MKTIEIVVKTLNNNTLFEATKECNNKGIETSEVSEIKVWDDNFNCHKMEFAFDVDGKIMGLQKKWD